MKKTQHALLVFGISTLLVSGAWADTPPATPTATLDAKLDPPSFSPDHAKLPTLAQASYFAAITQTNSGLSLAIKRQDQALSTIQLPTQTFREVYALTPGPAGSLIVLGRRGALNAIGIVDINSGELRDYFYGYAPSVSPNGSMIAFNAFFRTHGFNDGTEPPDIVQLYRLDQSPAANRVDAEFSADMDQNVFDAGHTVRLDPADASTVDEEKPFGMVPKRQSDFVWSADSSMVAYLEHRPHATSIVALWPGKAGTEPTRFAKSADVSQAVCHSNAERCYNSVAITLRGDQIIVNRASEPLPDGKPALVMRLADLSPVRTAWGRAQQPPRKH